KVSVDLVCEPISRLKRLAQSIPLPAIKSQKTLQAWLPDSNLSTRIPLLDMPRNINWELLAQVYQSKPSNYEELLAKQGVGPATIRGLALIAELIYGEKPSWADPVKYSFAYGGKDGVPFPVNRKSMDESIAILKKSVEAAKIGNKEKNRALEGLRRFVPIDEKALKLVM
ncbi:MAG: DUF763 domain-containing protein, partial [Bacteroidales bacterium]|nr:DUF763 domain-containing protein [Bacteroidales bacterium]